MTAPNTKNARPKPEETKPPAPHVIRVALQRIKRWMRWLLNLDAEEYTKAQIKAARKETEQRETEVDTLMKEEWAKLETHHEDGGSRPDEQEKHDDA